MILAGCKKRAAAAGSQLPSNLTFGSNRHSGRNSRYLTSISNVNRVLRTAFPPSPDERERQRETRHGDEQNGKIEARICGDGSGKAARNREQRRQGEPRRRAQEQLQPLTRSSWMKAPSA
jgi:hypothetical protein